MVGVQEVIHIKKIIQKRKKKFDLLFMNGMSSWIFIRISWVPSIPCILVIKIGSAVFKKIRFFYFSKFVHNFCKKKFFELILGVNLSCDRSHLPSQYGSKPSVAPRQCLSCYGFCGVISVHALRILPFMSSGVVGHTAITRSLSNPH